MKKLIKLVTLLTFCILLTACDLSDNDIDMDTPDAVYIYNSSDVEGILFRYDSDHIYFGDDTGFRPIYDMSMTAKTRLNKDLKDNCFALTTMDTSTESGGIDGRCNITIKKITNLEATDFDQAKSYIKSFDLDNPNIFWMTYYNDYLIIQKEEDRTYVVFENKDTILTPVTTLETMESVANYLR